MARINKFAAQNLNDIYGRKEPKPPTPTDNANPAGNRPRGSGMLVLTRPVKQPQPPPSLVPKDGKTTQSGLGLGLGLSSSSSSALKKENVPGGQAVQNPVSSTNPVTISIEKDNKPEVENAGSNPGKYKPAALITPPVENAKIETETISLRPQGVYTPPAARGMQAVHLPVGAGVKRPVSLENVVVSQEKTETPIAPCDQPAQTTEPLGSRPPGKESQQPIDEKGPETLKGEAIADAVPPPPQQQHQIKPSRPEPFRPPQMRGDGAARIAKTEAEAGPSYPPTPPRDDPSLGRRDTQRNFQQQPRGRREERSVQEGGRYFRDPPQGRYDHPEDRLHERPGSGGSGYYYYNREGNSHSRPGLEGGRNYDIEVIRPGSEGSDYVKDRYNTNNRDFAYGGRQNFDRQMSASATDNLYREGHDNSYDSSYEHRQDFSRQDGMYRNNYNQQFRTSGVNREFVNRGGYGGGVRGGGGQRREQYGRNNHFGPGGQFRDNFGQPSVNGRFSTQQREQEGGFRHHSRMQRDTYGGGVGYRYNDVGHASNTGYNNEVYQRPRSGGYEGDSTRPGSGGYGGDVGGRPIGSTDSMTNRSGFYNGHRSPISHDRIGHEDYVSGLQGRYQFDGLGSRTNEMQGVDAGYQRPRSGGYRGIVSGRSMASSDPQMSSSNNYNDKIDQEGFSSRPQERYHSEGSSTTASEVLSSDFASNRRLDNSRDSFNEFDSYRPRQDIYKAEPSVDGEHQEIAHDCSMEYNILNSESFKKAGGQEEELGKAIYKVDTEQTVFAEDKRPYITEEEQKVENARKIFVDQDQFSEGMTLQKRQEGGLQQETVEVATNGEPIIESAESHMVIHGTSGQLKEEDSLANLYSTEEQDKLADRFASSKILAGHTPRQVQTDSASSTRPPNYYGSRGAGQQTNSYRSRSSSNSWRRENSETKNAPTRGFTSMYGEQNYRSQSRESSTSERYQF